MKHRHIFAGTALSMAFTALAFAGCSGLYSAGETPSVVAESGDTAQERAELIAAQGNTDEFALYQAAKEEGEFTGTFTEFLKEIGYTGQDGSAGVNRALTSAVSIYCGFTVSSQGSVKTATSAGSGVIYSLDKEAGGGHTK